MSAESSLRAQALEIPLRVSFRHASAEMKRTQSVLVEARRGEFAGYGEGCPRPYVTGETLAGSLAFIESVGDEVARDCTSLDRLIEYVSRSRVAIDRNPAAWCAVELALLDLLAKEQWCSVETLLGMPEAAGCYQYSAVVSDGDLERCERDLIRFLEFGFWDFKIKLNGDAQHDLARMRLVRRLVLGRLAERARIRVDANNLWPGRLDEAVEHLARLECALFGIEEPLAPRDVSGACELSRALGIQVILDESLCTHGDLDRFAASGVAFMVNVRVSKLGGLLRTLQIVDRCKQLGWGVIVGCQVGETSILSRAALLAARRASEQLRAQEGAFGTLLLTEDVVQPVIMFGSGGVLELAYRARGSDGWLPGFGFEFCGRMST